MISEKAPPAKATVREPFIQRARRALIIGSALAVLMLIVWLLIRSKALLPYLARYIWHDPLGFVLLIVGTGMIGVLPVVIVLMLVYAWQQIARPAEATVREPFIQRARRALIVGCALAVLMLTLGTLIRSNALFPYLAPGSYILWRFGYMWHGPLASVSLVVEIAISTLIYSVPAFVALMVVDAWREEGEIIHLTPIRENRIAGVAVRTTCQSCGKSVSRDAHYCRYCGAQLDKAESETT